MSLAEILDELPKLSFAERQELIRRAVELDEDELTPEEEAIINERLEDFRRHPDSGVPLQEVKSRVAERLRRG
jgi:hypothetical protein